MYAASRSYNVSNQARSRLHASEGNGDFLAFDPNGEGAGPSAMSDAEREREAAELAKAKHYTALAKSKDKELQGKVSGGLDAARRWCAVATRRGQHND